MPQVTTVQPTPGAAAPGETGLAPIMVPFTRASMEHQEPGNLDSTIATPGLAAGTVQLNAVDVPAYGYLRSMLIYFQATGGTGTAAVYTADAPWSSLHEVTLADINGSPIFGPVSGYDLYLVNKYGGYAWSSEPTASAAYVAPTTAGNYSFMLRVPIEVGLRDGLGSLPNMNAGANYQLKITLAAGTAVYSTPATAVPAVRIRAIMEAWAPPSTLSATGVPQAVQPPAVGTTQFWSYFVPALNAGENTVQLRRVGNLIRNLVLVTRNAAGARVATLPDPLRLEWDGRTVLVEPLAYRQHIMWERYGFAPDTGVLVYDFAHDLDGKVGGETRDQWLATVQSSRLEFKGSWGVAGTLKILTNDVAPEGNVFLG